MEEKFYWFMICYTWQANGQSGNGTRILKGDTESILNKDISEATDICKEFVGDRMHHDKNSIQIIFTNTIKLAHCSHSEFYKKDDT